MYFEANEFDQGTFGPMASAFNIIALVESWRVSIPPGATEATGELVPDPRWYG